MPTGTGTLDITSYEGFSAEALLLAMAPVERVLQASLPQDDTPQVQFQDDFARLIQKHWNSVRGPSKRYLRTLVKLFVRRVEDAHESQVESEELLALLLQVVATPALPSTQSALPNKNECCHLTYHLGERPLLLRIFPTHNDVSLRLWEAGAVLSEYLLQQPHWVQGKRVVELGSGVGLTGLVAAGPCRARSVMVTDYTEQALDNLRYNIEGNREWWLRVARNDEDGDASANVISESYLEWSAYGKEESVNDDDEDDTSRDCRLVATLNALDKAQMLLAADVVYDRTVIPCLARTVKRFLSMDVNNGKGLSRRAIFATTFRNQETFSLFQNALSELGITSRVLASGSACEKLPLVFPTKFLQPRTDIQICSLEPL